MVMQTMFLRHCLHDIKIVDKRFNECLNSNNIKYYENNFFPICLKCKRSVKVKKECEEYNIFTSQYNSSRLSVCQILIDGLKKYHTLDDKINLLNLGGLQLGDQDLCLRTVNEGMEWYTNEHPNVRYYYNNVYLKSKLKEMHINVIFNDLESGKNRIPSNYFDIILFTEIIEHLPISTLGKAIKHICNAIKRNGFLIVSTPNLVSFEHRIVFLFGRDSMYWGKTKQNIDNGFFGHIDYWHYKTLEKLINGYSFNTIAIYGYNNHFYSKEIRTRILSMISDVLSYINSNFSNTIFYVFQKT